MFQMYIIKNYYIKVCYKNYLVSKKVYIVIDIKLYFI